MGFSRCPIYNCQYKTKVKDYANHRDDVMCRKYECAKN